MSESANKLDTAFDKTQKEIKALNAKPAPETEIVAKERELTSVAAEIDEVKSRAIEGIGSIRSWDDVADTADSIALLHGKPTYTKDVDTYSETFTQPQYVQFGVRLVLIHLL